MSNYQEGQGPFPEGATGGGGAPHQEGAPYQGGQRHPGGATAYQGGGGYQGGAAPQQETSQFQGAPPQQWEGQQQYPQQYGQPYEQHGQQGQRGMFQGGGPLSSRGRRPNVRSTFKTTEFWAYVVVAVGLLIAAAVTDRGPDNQGFSAQDAWKYVTWLTIGYLISRGLTKFGGHEHD